MVKKDINLFKAAGGDKAKGGKKSAVTYFTVFVMIVVIGCLGLVVYFNQKVTNAKNKYQEKEVLSENYNTTKINVEKLSAEYLAILSDIASAEEINTVINIYDRWQPRATESEVAAIKNTVINNPAGMEFTFSDKFVDYSVVRNGLDKNLDKREMFYYALTKLEADQKASKKTNVWYTYYRGYFTMVFMGGENGVGIDSLIGNFNADYLYMEGESPFMRVTYQGVENDKSLYTVVIDEATGTVYNVVMCPMKSVIERLIDVLDKHAAAIVDANGWTGEQLSFAQYGITGFTCSQEVLEFGLLLSNVSEVKFSEYCNALDNSPFFEVSEDVLDKGEVDGTYMRYNVKLMYKNN